MDERGQCVFYFGQTCSRYGTTSSTYVYMGVSDDKKTTVNFNYDFDTILYFGQHKYQSGIYTKVNIFHQSGTKKGGGEVTS